MNYFHLCDPIVKETLQQIWSQPLLTNFKKKLRKTTKFYKLFCIKKAKKKRESEIYLRIELAKAQATLHKDPYSPALWEKNYKGVISTC